jgi:hypothetical protein
MVGGVEKVENVKRVTLVGRVRVVGDGCMVVE